MNLDRLPANAVTLSVAGHLLLLLVLGLNWSLWQTRPDRPVRLAIDAAVVMDSAAVKQREQAEQQRREAEQQRRREEARRAVDEQRQKDEAAQKQRDKEAAARKQQADQQRKAEEAKKAAEVKRQKEEADRKQREREAAERKKQEAEQQRKAAEARRQKEREAQMAAQLAAEEARDNAVSAGLLEQWIELIRQRVQRNWVKPASAKPGIECEVRVSQIPGGEVVDVRVGRCNGDDAVIRSIQNAVFRASPLPQPSDASLFERNFTLVFKPEE